jgi:vitamin B12 transporter
MRSARFEHPLAAGFFVRGVGIAIHPSPEGARGGIVNRFVSALALSAAIPFNLSAQQSDTLSDTTRLADIVVTATRVAGAPATAATTVLHGEDLRRRGIIQVKDALREVAGASIVQTGSFGGLTSLYLRGGESGYTQVLVDGIPVNEPGGAFDHAHLLTEDVERIEIVRGPTSVLYGTDAVTGVIQVFTRRGAGDARVSLTARGGNYGTVDLTASVRGGAADQTVSYGVTLGQYTTSGIHDFNSGYRNTYLNSSVALRPDSATDVRAIMRYGDDRFEAPTDGSGNVVDRNAYEFGQRISFGVDAGRFLTNRVEARVQLAAHTVDGGFNDQADGPADTLGFYGSSSLNDVTRRSVDGRFNIYATSDVVVTVGGHVEQEEERSFDESMSEFGPSNGSFEARRWNRAGYVQVAGGVSRFSWQAGARYDNNDTFGEFATYRVGASVRVLPNARIRGAFGTAFREPTFFQNFATGFVRGNPDLEVEEATSWEVGFDQQLADRRLRVSATYFNQRFDELIEFTFSPPNPDDPNYFNIAMARSGGVEITVDADLPRGIHVSGGYSFVDTEVLEGGFDQTPLGLFPPGGQLLRRPRHSGHVRAGLGTEGLSLDAAAYYTGERDDVDFNAGERVILDEYVTLDVSGRFVVHDRGGRTITLEARVANALDHQYEAVFGFAAPGRSLLAGLRVGL